MRSEVEGEVKVKQVIIIVDIEVDQEGNYLLFSYLENSRDHSSHRRTEHRNEEKKEELDVKSELQYSLI